VRTPIALAVYAGTLALLAGCGSSGTSAGSSSAASTTQAAASTQAAAGSSYSHYGPSTSSSSTTSTATPVASTGAPAVVLSKRAKLGTVLAAGPKHMTVYLFEADTSRSSACSGACASVWPRVRTASAPSAGPGAVPAALGTLVRADGTKQVTYNGHPLYFFAQDKDMGDAYGQGVKGFGSDWYVLTPNGKKLDKS
jgi:predicted lipoprotein with Yx(FWY)xxD motif